MRAPLYYDNLSAIEIQEEKIRDLVRGIRRNGNNAQETVNEKRFEYLQLELLFIEEKIAMIRKEIKKLEELK